MGPTGHYLQQQLQQHEIAQVGSGEECVCRPHPIERPFIIAGRNTWLLFLSMCQIHSRIVFFSALLIRAYPWACTYLCELWLASAGWWIVRFNIFCSAGFNAAVAGSFFAIETVLRPLRAENSPPFTTAMIILASVISSTVSNAVLGEKQAFTVPTYDMKSAAGIWSNSSLFYYG